MLWASLWYPCPAASRTDLLCFGNLLQGAASACAHGQHWPRPQGAGVHATSLPLSAIFITHCSTSAGVDKKAATWKSVNLHFSKPGSAIEQRDFCEQLEGTEGCSRSKNGVTPLRPTAHPIGPSFPAVNQDVVLITDGKQVIEWPSRWSPHHNSCRPAHPLPPPHPHVLAAVAAETHTLLVLHRNKLTGIISLL